MTPNVLLDFFIRSDQIARIEVSTFPWELLIRQSRQANLLSRVAFLLQQEGKLKELPTKVAHHFSNAIKIADANKRASLHEIKDVERILRAHNLDFILLKGCAYLWSDLDASRGRLFADTDILIRKKDLSKAEKAFAHNGWVTTKIDHYDQHYYRAWTHEIPPLHHTRRHTTLDVHHNIVPPIIETGFNIDAFWSKAVQDPGHKGLFCLQPDDMILHSATHLFHEGEFDNGLRDLVDLDSLLRHHMTCEQDWERLVVRARELDLILYLYYALNYTHSILKTPIPGHILEKSLSNAKINGMMKVVMDTLFMKVLVPGHVSCRPFGSAIAARLLLIRSHWLKMPWYLLLPHLFRKTFSK